ncbi:MAG: hypothetical protein HQ596_03395 [Candidatus Saganbacteria bacterium]|nr:hypothetical protein [Candidatus Saganbacteria bacterium]
MNKLVEKLKIIEDRIIKEQGEFVLLALFLREDAQDKWDLIVSANWFEEDTKKTLDYLVDKLNGVLEQDDKIQISRVVMLKPSDPFVKSINSVIKAKHGAAHFVNCRFNNLYVKEAIIITSTSSNGQRAS